MNKFGLDVDGVLADTHNAFLETYNEYHETSYDLSDIEYWDWPIDEFGLDEFVRLTDEEWKDETSINPCEPKLSETVNILADEVEVHIVTAREGCDTEIQSWLRNQNITDYESFIGA